ncbi:hypothetical protein PLICRDRAFT_32385 [Plicaturopsis crispa FD-325 SS-3]|uniref:Carbonic anhydrase n=1 Tax=Plicaturopsis crispa FD-325 SS-3 TaxID=944288 RepID=A0A0C9T4T4_PLICR|nr:hypothetical protein PLICRDRAFT_32385 [Plicaturopsis crispa FD-325 SS-3]
MASTTLDDARDESSVNPREEFAAFLESNKQWSDKVNQEDPNFLPELAKKQEPAILWIGCADSRVPETVILNGLPGDVFTTRNIANQFLPDDNSVQAILQYAVGVAHVRHIIVVGHTNCGGIISAYNAAYPIDEPTPYTYHKGLDASNTINSVDQWIAPLIQLAVSTPGLGTAEPGPERDRAVHELAIKNVERQVDALCSSHVVRSAWAHAHGPPGPNSPKLVGVHGCLYHLESGLLEDLKISRYRPSH